MNNGRSIYQYSLGIALQLEFKATNILNLPIIHSVGIQTIGCPCKPIKEAMPLKRFEPRSSILNFFIFVRTQLEFNVEDLLGGGPPSKGGPI